jgi:hypothetical protein
MVRPRRLLCRISIMLPGNMRTGELRLRSAAKLNLSNPMTHIGKIGRGYPAIGYSTFSSPPSLSSLMPGHVSAHHRPALKPPGPNRQHRSPKAPRIPRNPTKSSRIQPLNSRWSAAVSQTSRSNARNSARPRKFTTPMPGHVSAHHRPALLGLLKPSAPNRRPRRPRRPGEFGGIQPNPTESNHPIANRARLTAQAINQTVAFLPTTSLESGYHNVRMGVVLVQKPNPPAQTCAYITYVKGNTRGLPSIRN